MSAGSITLGQTREAAGARATWLSASRLLLVVAQLVLALIVIRLFRIEGPAFAKLSILVVAGFVVHAMLPMAWRMPFFAALSIGGTLLFAGVTNGLWIVGLGVGILAVASLPVRFGVRVALVLAAAVLLGLFRTALLPSGIPGVVWPILGSMFMFRLAVYLYDVRHGVEAGPPARAFAYFFMAPNVAFPLFPVVDYKTFVRQYYDDEAWRIYQRGARWIARGLLHLVVYRLIYHHMAMDLTEVQSGPQVIQYIVSSFMLYLRVSGMYHLAVGMLHLFGFRLPETNHMWLFCQSFTDLWRRMNIYFRDMMMKLIYYPSFFRVRKVGMRKGIVLALAAVFVMTWALHSVQWFWLRGSWLLSWQDGLFYVLLGSLVIWQTLKESKRKRGIDTGAERWSPRRAVNALLTMGTLMTMWSYWTADGSDQWLAMWGAITHWPLTGLAVVLGSVLVFLVLAGFPWRLPDLTAGREAQLRPALLTTGTLAVLWILGQPGWMERTSPRLATLMKPVQENQLNRRDNALLLRGYYEKVDARGQMADQVWQMQQDKPDDWNRITSTAVYRARADFLGGELVPSSRIQFKDQGFLVNRWGMHDQDYEREKPEGTFRVVLLGPSDVMGPGVSADQTFEALVEARLNQELAGAPYARYEILNLSVAAFTPLQLAAMLDQRALDFDPDLVLVSLHPLSDPPTSIRYLSEVVRTGREIPYPDLAALVREAGVDSTTRDAAAKRLLWPHVQEVLEWSYGHMAETARSHHLPIGLVVLDAFNEESPAEQPLIHYADSLGYAILDLRQATAGQDVSTLVLAEWDRHPNQAGHRLLADALYRELLNHREALGLATGGQATP